MSLEIDVEKISEVLLADGWHKVAAVGDGRSSFGIDVYEFHDPHAAADSAGHASADRSSSDLSDDHNSDEQRSDDSVSTNMIADAGPQPQSHASQAKNSKEQAGARWTESDGSRVFCPVTSILAVKYAGQKKVEGSGA